MAEKINKFMKLKPGFFCEAILWRRKHCLSADTFKGLEQSVFPGSDAKKANAEFLKEAANPFNESIIK